MTGQPIARPERHLEQIEAVPKIMRRLLEGAAPTPARVTCGTCGALHLRAELCPGCAAARRQALAKMRGGRP